MSNRKLGKYEIIERLGRGGMAEVFRAYHASLDRYVAIKILHHFLADDEEFSGRFGREAQNIARLRHPHIVQVYDYEFDADAENYYMVMELIDGETLKDRLFRLSESGERLSIDEALRITRESASALSYAHKSGMIHRDVKPANLMLDRTENDRVVLTDFGIAKIVTGSQFTMTGGLVGTPAYMSPEQGVGETGDERSDLYSLGVILYQMVSGKLPYEADTPLALILKHMNEPIPALPASGDNFPKQVNAVIKKLMAKEPEERYQNADALIAHIQQIERSLHRDDDTPVKPIEKPPVKVPLNLQPEAIDEDVDRPTIPFVPTQNKKTTPSPPAPASHGSRRPPSNRGFVWGIGIVFMIIFVLGGYAVGANQGVFPAVGFLASETPTETMTLTPTSTETPTDVPTETPVTPTATSEPPTETPTDIPTDTPIPPTDTPTEVPTETPEVPTATPEPPTLTLTPSLTPNATQTLSAMRTATTAACNFDYAIIEQQPEDGEDGGFFVTNTDYERTITLLNTGNCAWEVNTSLTFIEGEDFNAGPRIFIRERVEPSEDTQIIFDATLPSVGSVDPITGTWQLRTPGQIPIGEPFTISIMVYSAG